MQALGEEWTRRGFSALKGSWIVVAGVVLLAAGCAPGVGSEEQQGPRIGQPLDIRSFRGAAACGLLPDEQLPELGVDSPAPRPALPGCGRKNPEGTRLITIAVSRGPAALGSQPLSRLSEDHARMRESFRYFDPTSAAGYPAVFQSSVKPRTPGQCAITVGVADDSSFEVEYVMSEVPPGSPDACAVVQRAAEMVIDNVKAGKV
ncbi:DUF3558 domain-containing protein [Saccharopolyspora erythraea]|uniref:DUF3558 domain-containing protein n=1 Tax=Saccharopolyspora erythraea TaxID=1836 RepID=UPI00117BBB3C|nr:DUF3558 domain-containing protein [Saccharopolyspora erythraea]QRK91127.1 DUF3558 domain-containing protein [Saccharopolyspora erythraea]